VICYLIDREIGEEIMSSRRGMVFLASAFRRRDVRALEHVARTAVDDRREPSPRSSVAGRSRCRRTRRSGRPPR
jgi:hypothetical protein